MEYISTPLLYRKENGDVLFTFQCVSRVSTIEDMNTFITDMWSRYGTSTESRLFWTQNGLGSPTPEGAYVLEKLGYKNVLFPMCWNEYVSKQTYGIVIKNAYNQMYPYNISNIYSRLNALDFVEDSTSRSYYSNITIENTNNQKINGKITYDNRDTTGGTRFSGTGIATMRSGSTSGHLSLAYIDMGGFNYIYIRKDSSIIGKVNLIDLIGYFGVGGYIQNRPYYLYGHSPYELLTEGKLTQLTDFDELLVGKQTYVDPTNPYSTGGDSGSGGGGGSYYHESDSVNEPGFPELSATDTGFCTVYTPTIPQVQKLASYMWSDAFSLDSFKKLFADPMDAIIGLSVVPVDVPVLTAQEVTIGNISTGVSMNVASTQYVKVDCGAITIDEYWGSFMDYSPFTKASIYLPYVGTHQLNIDDIMGRTINVKYNVDILSGACVCYILVDNSVMYQFIGSLNTQIPFTSVSYSNMYQALANIAGSITLGVSGSASNTSGITSSKAWGTSSRNQSVGWSTNISPSSIVSNVMSMKPTIARGGGSGGSGGIIGVQYPYIILERPRQSVASSQNKFMGYPCNQTLNLGSISGFTVVQNINLHTLTATEEERNEIYSLLQKGVIL